MTGFTLDSELEDQRSPESLDPALLDSRDTRGRCSPNLSLNLGPPKAQWLNLRLSMLFGAALQCGVLIFAGLVTSYAPWKTTFLKDGKLVVPAALPVLVTGTLLLTCGMLRCAWTIEQSTREEVWMRSHPPRGSLGASSLGVLRPTQGAGPAPQRFQMLWLQRGKVVNDQTFKSYAIFAPFPRSRLVTSRRIKDTSSTFLGRLRKEAVEAPIMTLVGFVLQFSGLRMMHWSVTVAQFSGMAIMTCLRVWLRTGLARRPSTQQVDDGHEMDWLALALAAKGDDLWPASGDQPIYTWAVDTGEDTNGCKFTSPSMPEGGAEPEESDVSPHARKVLKIRTRLGQLSKWNGGSCELAISVATAIEAVMNALFAQEKDKKTITFTMNVNLMAYHRGWEFPVELMGKKLPVKFTIDIDKDTGLWKADVAGIEAALSLWLYSESQSTKHERSKNWDNDDWLRHGIKAPVTKSTRLLGPYTSASRRDLTWWGGSAVPQLLVLDARDTSTTDQSTSNQVSPEESTPSQDIPGDGMPERDIPSQDTSHQDSTTAGQDTDTQETLVTSGGRAVAAVEIPAAHVVGFGPWKVNAASADRDANQHPNFRSAKFKVLEGGLNREPEDYALLALPSTGPVERVYAQEFFSSFMWAVAKGLRDPIKDLNTTSQESTVVSSSDTPLLSFRLESPVLQEIVQNVHQTGLATTEEAYMLVIPPLSVKGRLPEPLAVIEQAREQMRVYEQTERWVDVGKVFKELSAMSGAAGGSSSVCQKTAVVLADLLQTLRETMRVLEGQNRNRQVLPTLKSLEDELQEERGSFSEKVISGLEEVDRLHQLRVDRGPEGSTSDTMDHRLDKKLEFVQQAHLCSKTITDIENLAESLSMLQDMDGGPGGGEQLGAHQRNVIDLADKIGGVNARDIFGWTLLHYAVARESKTVIQDLLAVGADVNSKDTKGWTPLHWAAKNGNSTAVSQILDYDADIDVVGRDGMRPLHFAASSDGKIVCQLLDAGANITRRDNFRRTPLHWAADLGRADIVDILLAKGAPINARDHYGRTPLQLAAGRGHKEAMDKLSDRGAEDAKGQDGQLVPPE